MSRTLYYVWLNHKQGMSSFHTPHETYLYPLGRQSQTFCSVGPTEWDTKKVGGERLGEWNGAWSPPTAAAARCSSWFTFEFGISANCGESFGRGQLLTESHKIHRCQPFIDYRIVTRQDMNPCTNAYLIPLLIMKICLKSMKLLHPIPDTRNAFFRGKFHITEK